MTAIFENLQKLGRALMLPIAVLPVAGLLLEGVVLRLQADLRWLEACAQYWITNKER